MWLTCWIILNLSSATVADDWPQFRGPNRDAISNETGLLRQWPEGGPQVIWKTEVCEGYAGAAIVGERVFFEDYDKAKSQWVARCVSLADGKDIWRITDEKRIRPNHGITRTVPAVDDKHAFFLDPKCVLHCVDVATGQEVWRKDLVEEYKTTIPRGTRASARSSREIA